MPAKLAPILEENAHQSRNVTENDGNGLKILVIAEESAVHEKNAPSYDRCYAQEYCVILFRRNNKQGLRLNIDEFRKTKETFTFIHIAPDVFLDDEEIEQVASLLEPNGKILYFAAFSLTQAVENQFIYFLKAYSRKELCKMLLWAREQKNCNFLIRFDDLSIS